MLRITSLQVNLSHISYDSYLVIFLLAWLLIRLFGSEKFGVPYCRCLDVIKNFPNFAPWRNQYIVDIGHTLPKTRIILLHILSLTFHTNIILEHCLCTYCMMCINDVLCIIDIFCSGDSIIKIIACTELSMILNILATQNPDIYMYEQHTL